MANDNFPRGMVPLQWPSPAVSLHAYRVSTANDIYVGMPVALAAAGYVIGIGTPTGVTQSIGVAMGFLGANQAGLASNQPYLKVSDLTPPTPTSDTGDRWVLVADDPNQRFVVQEDTGGTALALTEQFAACDLLFRGAGANVVNGDNNTGWANLELDRSQVVTTSAAFVQILQLQDKVNSDGTANAVGNYGKWIVRLLHHAYRGAAVAQPQV